jgi:hypothetical protein
VTKFRIVIATLIVSVGGVAFLGTAAHAADTNTITDQFYAPTFVPPTTTPTTVPLFSPPPSTPSSTPPPTSPPTTAGGSRFIPSSSTSVPASAVKVVTVAQPAQAAPLAATGALAFTGADVASLVGIALLLLVVGAELIRRGRHRAVNRS